MKAIINATGWSPALEAAGEHLPSGMLPLVDRPFLQHVVEFLVSRGAYELELILWQAPEKVEARLGDGSRWGCRFQYHLVRDRAHPHAILEQRLAESSEPWLLAQGDTLPKASLAPSEEEPGNIMYLAPDGQWSGWAWLAPGADEVGGLDLAGLAAWLKERQAVELTCPGMLACRDHGQLLASHSEVLEKRFFPPLWSGREVEPGIWLSRNVILHPTARLIPPVYVGPDCRIGQGAQVGPMVSLGWGCLLDSHCALSQVVVFPASYVGRDLEVSEALVDRNRLVSVRLGAALELVDDFLLGNLADSPLRRLFWSSLGRLLAGLLLVISSPFILACIFWLKWRRSGKVVHRRRVVGQPGSRESGFWREYDLISLTPEPRPLHHPGLRDLLLRVMPGLWNVLRGDLNVVGLPPLSAAELKGLSKERRSLYCKTKAGLVNEATAMLGGTPDPDQSYMAEAYYAALGGGRHDLKIMGLYLRRLFKRTPATGGKA